MTNKKYLFLLLIVLIISTVSSRHNVAQLTNLNIQQTLQGNDFTLLYIYSSSCKYCAQFTPLFQKLSINPKLVQKNLQFTKIDGQTYKLQNYDISSFPTVILIWKNYTQTPIYYYQQRKEANLIKFIEENTKINEQYIPQVKDMSVYQRIQQKVVIYYGHKSSPIYQLMALVWNRDKFFLWTIIQSQQEKVIIGGKQLIGAENLTISNIQTTIKKTYARLHTLGQEPWTRIFARKQLGIVYINTEKNTRVPKLLNQLAKQYQGLVFLQITPQHSQYKSALKMFGIIDQQSLIAVDRKADAVFVANGTYKRVEIKEFIQKVQKYQWPVYRKSQRSTKTQKLTRQNYEQRMSTKQDVIMFLYKRNEKISQSLVSLFNHLRNKLKDNQNLLFLRCDVSSNQIQQFLGFMTDKTPKIVFFRNRMKDKPIHFYNQKISEQSVTEFIMENVTFDWKDQWGEL